MIPSLDSTIGPYAQYTRKIKLSDKSHRKVATFSRSGKHQDILCQIIQENSKFHVKVSELTRMFSGKSVKYDRLGECRPEKDW